MMTAKDRFAAGDVVEVRGESAPPDRSGKYFRLTVDPSSASSRRNKVGRPNSWAFSWEAGHRSEFRRGV